MMGLFEAWVILYYTKRRGFLVFGVIEGFLDLASLEFIFKLKISSFACLTVT
jgi:hypothetical protein